MFSLSRTGYCVSGRVYCSAPVRCVRRYIAARRLTFSCHGVFASFRLSTLRRGATQFDRRSFAKTTTMNYRRLGASGLKVSELSFGSWVTYGNQMGEDLARDCMVAAYEAGANFFDNAEVYAKGRSETIMGNVLKKEGWRRSASLVATKFFWGLNDGPNEKNSLNRKYLMEAIDGSLGRLQLDHVDLLFCHRPDPETPVEKTVWAMHDLIGTGRARSWGRWGGG